MAQDLFPIQVDLVRKRYPGGVEALRGVSFRLAPGERACLLGPNGAGKTTLIRLLTGALEPTAGKVFLFGTAVGAEGYLEVRRRCGIVPQQPGMYRDLKLREYLELAAALYRTERLPEVVERFGLGEYLERKMGELSGGWQRRMLLATALLGDPELLLLDEPTVGLDPVAAREMHGLLREAMRGRSALLCTHNLAEAEALCESALILRAGQLLVHETLPQLRRQARTQLVVTALQGPRAVQAVLLGAGVCCVVLESEARVALVDPPRESPALLKLLWQAGLEVVEARLESPTLESLFLDIVKQDA